MCGCVFVAGCVVFSVCWGVVVFCFFVFGGDGVLLCVGVCRCERWCVGVISWLWLCHTCRTSFRYPSFCGRTAIGNVYNSS